MRHQQPIPAKCPVCKADPYQVYGTMTHYKCGRRMYDDGGHVGQALCQAAYIAKLEEQNAKLRGHIQALRASLKR